MRVTAQQNLETCQKFDMMSDYEWELQFIDITQSIRLERSFFRVQRDTVYISLSLYIIEGVYVYQYLTSDEVIMSEINPSLVHIKELCIAHYHDLEN